jgi:hypothetical protein
VQGPGFDTQHCKAQTKQSQNNNKEQKKKIFWDIVYIADVAKSLTIPDFSEDVEHVYMLYKNVSF